MIEGLARMKCAQVAALESVESVHMVGVGGVGMEGMARFLVDLGYRVSGSDRDPLTPVAQLRLDGIEAHLGHAADHVASSQLVVYSAAVSEENEELAAARNLGIRTLSRAQMLGELSRAFVTVSVAGTHGKTTTASMVASILRSGGLSPSELVGGRRGGRAQGSVGSGDLLVLEADEFDGALLQVRSQIAVLTNAEAEHMDRYRDLDELYGTFRRFLKHMPVGGTAVVNGDDKGARAVVSGLDRQAPIALSFGLGDGNDIRACGIQVGVDVGVGAIDIEAGGIDIEKGAMGSRFSLCVEGAEIGVVDLAVPGLHNVANAVAAAAVARALQVDFQHIGDGLAAYRGADRRLEVKGEFDGVLVIDDYAHHPTEVEAALSAVRVAGRRVIAVFQPHLYSRTRAFCAEFARALQRADAVYLTSVYGSREIPDSTIHAGQIADAMRSSGFEDVVHVPDILDLPDRLKADCVAGDLVITLGAGNINTVADALTQRAPALPRSGGG
jgi:UDP-N-acetylmuramate--alanine ligase